MAAVVDQAVVLRVWDFSETSQTAVVLSRGHGLLRGLAKGSRRESARFGGGLDPLTRGEIGLVPKPGAELTTLVEWDLAEVFWGVRRDLAAHRAGLYIADLVHHAILDQDPHVRLYDALVESLRALDSADTSGPLARFQWRLLTEIGYQPRLDGEAHGGALVFNPAAGGIVAGTGAGAGWRVRDETVEALRRMSAGDPSGGGMSGAVSERAGRLLAEYLRHVLGRDLATRALVYGAGLSATPASTQTECE